MPPVFDQKKIEANIKKISHDLRKHTADLLVKKTHEEYERLARELLVNGGRAQPQFVNQVLAVSRTTDALERDDFEEAALEVIPFEKVYATVEANLKKQKEAYEKKSDVERSKATNYSYEDFLVKEILRWFKEDFFKWVNKDDCPYCGNSEQDKLALMGNEGPTNEERVDGGASNVEIYKCLKCNKNHRFPRYNLANKLLSTKKGRCGEFAACFYVVLRSLSLKVRYIWNKEDHVWTEYYSENFGRWIHLDSCENAYNEPLLYCNNWGKKMSYVFGTSPYGFVDLSNKYIDQRKGPQDRLPRSELDEAYLKKVVRFADLSRKRLVRDKMELYKLYVMDANEQKLLRDPKQIYDTTLLENHGRKGRISGSQDWKESRGEGGH